MKQTYSAASIYGIIDRMDANAIQAWIDWHKRLKYPSRFINMFTAARFEQAPNLLRQLRDSLPMTTPIWRGFDGKDAWGNIPPAELEWNDSNFYLRLHNVALTSAKMAAGLWFTRRVKPYVEMIRETGTIIHLLNEATPLFNAPFETEQIRPLGEEGIRAGAFAWTAGSPDWPDYQQQAIADDVAMAAKYGALVMCHEYAGEKPEEQNSLINRNETLTKLFPKDQQPDVFLGEFALAKATIKTIDGKEVIELDPDRGAGEMGVTDQQYFEFISSTAKAWYLARKISFSIYSWPDWGKNGSFGVGNNQGLLDHLAGASEWMCFEVTDAAPVAQPPPQPSPVNDGGSNAPIVMGQIEGIVARPAEAQIGIRARIKSIPAPFRNMRADHNYTAADTGDLAAGDVVRRFDIPAYDGQVTPTSSGKWVFVEKLNGDTVVASGWVWRDRIVWESVGSTQEMPVVIPPSQSSPVATGEETNAESPPVEHWPSAPVEQPPPVVTTQKLKYSWEIETTPEMHHAIEQALMGILLSVATLGQALAKAQVTLVTEAAPKATA